MARLRGRAERAAAVEIVLDLERGRREWTIDLPIPQGSSVGLVPILRERFSADLSREPLESHVTEVRFTVTETAPGHGSQRDLFSSDEDESEAWDALVGRLCQKLGKDNAFSAVPVDRYLPEKAWERAAEALDRLPTDVPPRPARLLKKPQALRKEGDLLIAEKPSGRSRTPKTWRIAEWHGPERIAVEWWMDPRLKGYNRDYFRVVSDLGEQLWIFAIPASDGFYLHGYFD
jgi:protein ImuB